MVFQPDEAKVLPHDERVKVGVLLLYNIVEDKCAMAAGFDLAYNELSKLKDNKVMTDIKHIITNDLIFDLGKLFSSPKRNDTISLFALDIENNPELENRLNDINNDYEQYRTIRDKRVSHFDMETFTEMEPIIVEINNIQDLLLRIKEFIKSAIPNWDYYFDLYDFDGTIDSYHKIFKELFKNM